MELVRTYRSRRENLTVFPLLILLSLPFVGALFFVAHRSADSLLNWAHCSLRNGTGIPCPTCGSTLAITRLAEGQWLAGLAANPLLGLLLIAYFFAIVGTVVVTIAPRWHRRLVLSGPEKKTAKWLAASLLLLNWLWLLLRVCA